MSIIGLGEIPSAATAAPSGLSSNLAKTKSMATGMNRVGAGAGANRIKKPLASHLQTGRATTIGGVRSGTAGTTTTSTFRKPSGAGSLTGRAAMNDRTNTNKGAYPTHFGV